MEQSIDEILSAIDKAIANFQETIPGIQKLIFDELQPILKKLEIKNGKLLNNVANLQLIGGLKNKLEKIIISAQYKQSVQEFIDSFSTVSKLNNQYFAQFNDKFKPKKTLPIIKQLAVESTINNLMGQGMSASVIEPIQKILNQNITTGGDYANFQDILRNYILTNETGDGALESYTKQITTDAINQYSAQYHDAIAQDLQFNWGRYVGSNIKTSREFCIWLTKKQWVHRSELPGIIKGHIDNHDCKISKSTGLPIGMIPGTNVDNFKVLRGGYNCGHQFFWVPDNAVPENIRGNFEQSGKFDQTNFISELKGTNITSINNEIPDKLKQNNYTVDDMINIVGGVFNKDFKDVTVSIFHAGNSGIKVIANSKNYFIERLLFPDEKRVYNANFFIDSEKGGGNGIKAFINQINQLKGLGYEKMNVSAGLSSSMNGAITWARFGYEMKKESMPEFNKLMAKNNRPEKSLIELMSTQDGIDFWKKNAFWFEGEFDLNTGSDNINALQKYLDEKGYNYDINQ